MNRAGEMKISGRMVLVTLVAFFAIIASVNALMATLAIRTFGGVEVENAYRAGLEFARELGAAREQQARNIQVDIVTRRLADGRTDFRLTAGNIDAAGGSQLRVVLELRHPADRRHDQIVVMNRIGAGTFGAQSEIAPGQWNVSISLDRGGERIFRSVNRIAIR